MVRLIYNYVSNLVCYVYNTAKATSEGQCIRNEVGSFRPQALIGNPIQLMLHSNLWPQFNSLMDEIFLI